MSTIPPGTAGIMSSNEQTANYAPAPQSATLGQDAFLKILITQLTHQDPTSPMSDTDFIAQMAQFSSLEQMNNVANELRGLRQMFGLSSSMIGKSVEWIVKDGDIDVKRSGVVDSIVLREGRTLIVVGDEEIPFDSIVRVYETPSEPGDPTDPGDPGEPGDPTDPTDPTDPGDPEDAEDPSSGDSNGGEGDDSE